MSHLLSRRCGSNYGKNGRRRICMKAGGFAALVVWFVLMASSVRAQSTPSLNLEGAASLGPGPAACAPAGCSGLFSATLSGQLAQAVNQAALQMNLQVGGRFACSCGPQAAFPCPLLIPCPAPADALANPVSSPAPTAGPRATAKTGSRR